MRKKNFIIYHFLVESKSHKRIDLLIIASVNIYLPDKEKKYSNSNENMLFCRKTEGNYACVQTKFSIMDAR